MTNRGKTYLAIAFESLIFSYLIITLNFFPHLGFAVSFITFLLFAYKLKKDKTKDTKLYLTFALVFSALLFVRSELVITFFNFLAVFFFGLLMLVADLKSNAGFFDYIYTPFTFVLQSVLTKNSDYYLEFKKAKENTNSLKVGEAVVGTLLTLLLMAIVLPLLSSVNPFFQKIVENIWSILNLENLLTSLGFEKFFIWILRLIFFLTFIFLIPKVLTLINKRFSYTLPFSIKSESLPLFLPKLVLTLTLLIFFITQLQFYFASDTALTAIGVSHSQRTREVFAQLTIVAGIILVLIYNARNKGVYDKILNWILGIQGVFLTLMAYKSVFDYISAWGLTYKRLYGLTFGSWIAGIFILFFIHYRRGNASVWFVKKTLIFSSVILILVNIFNFDYLIYHFGKSATGQGVDYTYLSTLSADSLSYKDQFRKLEEATAAGGYSQSVYDNKNPLLILYKIESLQRKYEKFDFRTLNLLDYLQYRQIESIDTENVRSYYTGKLYPRFPQ